MTSFVIRPGDLIFVGGSDLLGRIIEEVTDSPYCHVAGLVKENELIEAQGFRKTGYQGLDYYAGRADVYTCDSLTNEQIKEIVEYVTDFVGTRYDYLLLAWEWARYKLHRVWPYKETKTRICSTLWADAYREAGVDLCPGIIYPTPGDLAKSSLLRKVCSF
ncbi:hypothetical protein DNHGIG_25990 [Collibacillus ludicampi]|uniref:Uncharacterized protein n=1 Tax=Collibacillus ludicampi TaxID=2771369 RepID=A0AAV4LGT8_9BACL|nr:hypothetical protein [Collibacillus ludicampi]GIM47050.1 hypothetical protein DNHGIG_25990 [Collibacillus ludicampi]